MNEVITVNGKPFIGRVEEQKQFRTALREVLDPPKGETLPYVVLLYGDGGIGKTTLARRFRDLATEEKPFKDRIQILWVDWEEERARLTALQVEPQQIRPETVFDVLYDVAARQGWGNEFAAYKKVCAERQKVEQAAMKALQTGGERDDLAIALRGLGAGSLAALVRRVIPIGEQGEKLARVFLESGIEVGAQGAFALRQNLETRLRARLGPQFELYLNPHEKLAGALATGFCRLSRRKPLLVVLDTCEIVDRADPWLRLVMLQSGPRVLWLVSGRNNLRDSRRYGETYWRGYSEDWPRRLLAYDLAQLALEDVKAYFAARVPTRPLDDSAAQAIRRATYGIPLALAQAAEMWERGLSLDKIAPAVYEERLPGEGILRRMTERYLVHAVKDEDRRALYALAIARGNLTVLRALLAPDDGAPFDLDSTLHRLERSYASVMAFQARLHDEAQTFLEHYLRQPVQRQSDPVRDLLCRAEAALRAELARLQANLPLLEERALDEDWQRVVLALTDLLFWQEETRAWEFLLPRYLEALAYNRDLGRALLRTARRWQNDLSAQGKHRLMALIGGEPELPVFLLEFFVDESDDLIQELKRAAERGWLGGEGEGERRAILDWLCGRRLYAQKRYAEALSAFEAAERGLPPQGEVLRERLAEALYTLSGALLWPNDPSSPVHHPDAVRVLHKVTTWQPQHQDAWYRLGVAFKLAGQHDEAISAYQQAIALDPKYAAPWNGLGLVYEDREDYPQAIAHYRKALEIDPKFKWAYAKLGDVYRKQGHYDEALTAYQQAIALDPKLAAPWNWLGVVYLLQGKPEEALTALRKAVELAPNEGMYRGSLIGVLRRLGREAEAQEEIERARPLMERESEYNRACFAAVCGETDEALRLLAIALEKRQVLRAWARQDPDLHALHGDPRFWALIGQRP